MADKIANTSENKRLYTGEVVSDKMDKTIVVKIERTFKHAVFHKTVRRFKKFKVHDENGQAKVGDVVEFYEGRPLSKTKFMYLERVIKPSTVG